jgi:hypothetical protein
VSPRQVPCRARSLRFYVMRAARHVAVTTTHASVSPSTSFMISDNSSVSSRVMLAMSSATRRTRALHEARAAGGTDDSEQSRRTRAREAPIPAAPLLGAGAPVLFAVLPRQQGRDVAPLRRHRLQLLPELTLYRARVLCAAPRRASVQPGKRGCRRAQAADAVCRRYQPAHAPRRRAREERYGLHASTNAAA